MNAPELPKLVIITGPTASGKSHVALRLAKEIGGELISADSMQVYRGLDIGTAKPTPEELSAVPHHLIDVADITESYNAGRFREEAIAAIEDIRGRGACPIVVGGTALYIKVLTEGLLEGPGRDDAIHEELVREWEERGGEPLYERLAIADPLLARRLHPNDKSRIIRGLEVYLASGRALSDLQREHSFAERPFNTYIIGMDIPRPLLYKRIDARVDEMVGAGWVEEVRGILAKGHPPTILPLQAIGYRELVEYIVNGGDLGEITEEIKRSTRRFSKRQMTFMRKLGAHWMTPDKVDDIFIDTKKFLQIL